MTEFQTWVEIPITVHYTKNPAEGDGWNSPRIPAHIMIDRIELADDLEDWVIEQNYDTLVEEARENER